MNRNFLFPRHKKLLCASLLVVSLLGTLSTAQQAPTYTLSVVPQLPRLVLFEDWQPLLDHLSATLGVSFELRVEDSIPSFERSFLQGAPDFIFLNPYHQVMAAEAQGYVPLVSDASRQLKGILVVKEDSPYQTVQDLAGQPIAFPSPNAFGASLYMRALLADQGVTFVPAYVETHSNAYRYVILGQAVAGGGVRNTLSKEPEALASQLRVIYETPGVRPHPLSAHPRVPETVRDAVVEAVLALYESGDGRQLLKAVQLSQPVRVDYAGDYAGLADLDLENYIVTED